MGKKNASKNSERFDQLLLAAMQAKFGSSTEITKFDNELSRVRIRRGVQFDSAPGDRIKVVVELRLNRPNRPLGLFVDERAGECLIIKDDIVQINERGPSTLIGGLFQVAKASDTTLECFCLIGKTKHIFEYDQVELIGPAVMVTQDDDEHPTEPMNHALSPDGAVVHPTQVVEAITPEQAANARTAPMGHAINEEAKAKDKG